jgi:NADH-quinone oxidoreductase subunit J
MLVMIAVLLRADKMPVPYEQSAAIGTIKNLGVVLLNEYLFPFEFASVLFLSAMVGAVLISKKDKTLSNK